MKGKFNNRKVVVDGISFDSMAESYRYTALKGLSQLGVIHGLELQKPYLLCKGKWKNGRTFRITYKADFVYERDGEIVVEDVKGVRTREYGLKKKLMMAVYGIEITEINAKDAAKIRL